jgi:hypothetical protein
MSRRYAAGVLVVLAPLVLYAGQRPSGAKAGLVLWNLAARLEAAPFQNGFTDGIFPQDVKPYPTQDRL